MAVAAAGVTGSGNYGGVKRGRGVDLGRGRRAAAAPARTPPRVRLEGHGGWAGLARLGPWPSRAWGLLKKISLRLKKFYRKK